MVYITYIYGDLGDGLWNCFTHIIVTSTISPHSSPSQPSQFSYRLGTSTQHCFTNICLVVWNIFYFSIQLGRIIPTVFHIFQRGRYTTNQIWLGLCFTIVLPNIYPTFTRHLPNIYVMKMRHVWFFHLVLRFNSKVRKMPGPSDHAKTPGPGAFDRFQRGKKDPRYGDSMWFSKKYGNCFFFWKICL